ncbi:MAG: alkaline phosphatase family protein [Gammaproteobacteria bacterium]|nr:alkaline phosphatase family protein [Gammaproteobacteria bacterium]
MKSPLHQDSIASLTPSICHLLGVKPPENSAEPALNMVISTLEKKNLPLQKCLIVAQDAIGAHLWKSHESELNKLLPLVPLRVPLQAVFPPVTPVCFASIFTGAQPDVHGIHSYTRPVLECDTLFDALVRADKKVAIVSVKNSSIDIIFRNRDLAYFSEDDDQAVTKRTLDVIQGDEYDVIVAYQANYDDNLHRTEPFSPICIAALVQHIQDFRKMAEAANLRWKDKGHVVAFAPDHGAHINPSTGKGDHGLDIREDMDVFHCYGIFTGEQE